MLSNWKVLEVDKLKWKFAKSRWHPKQTHNTTSSSFSTRSTHFYVCSRIRSSTILKQVTQTAHKRWHGRWHMSCRRQGTVIKVQVRCLQSRHSIQIRFYSIFCGHIHCVAPPGLHPPTVLWDTWQISGALGRSVDTAVSECNTTHYHQFILPAHNRYLNHCPCTQCTLLWLHNVVNIKYTT